MSASPRALAWARVLRLSLFPSAVADPTVGALLGGAAASPLTGHEAGTLALVLAASLMVYHGAMALNDWADREVDSQRGRSRPLVHGELAPAAVLSVAALLLFGGPTLVHLAVGSWPATLALGGASLVAVLYDLVGRGALVGPLLLGLARGANLLFGALALGWRPGESLGPAVAAASYGSFVFLIGCLGRMEDGEDQAPLGTRPSRLLSLLAAGLISLPLLVALVSRLGAGAPDSILLAWSAVPIGLALVTHRARLLCGLRAPVPWTAARVEAAMGPVLGSLVTLTVGMLLLAVPGPGSWAAGAALLFAQKLGRRMMRFIPPS